jgi:ZIP family zinc transporter
VELSTAQTVLLGAIAGFTIFLGLPLGRMRGGSRTLRTFLNGLSAGILTFLFLEIMFHAYEPTEESFSAYLNEGGSFGHMASMITVFVVGLGVGLLSLLYVGKMWRNRPAPKSITGQSLGPGAMAVAERPAVQSDSLRLGMSIAVGIGLHNFSEGLAIGQSAAGGEVQLAVLLVIGFALHNATEGFGIVGPLAADHVRPSWKWLGIAGLVGGGPTFLGTLVGTAVTSELLEVLFLALAGGAILYVIAEILNAGRKMSWETTLWGVFAGFLVGAGTEFVLVAAGL